MKSLFLIGLLVLAMFIPSLGLACEVPHEKEETQHCEHQSSEQKDAEKHTCCHEDAEHSKESSSSTERPMGCAGKGLCCCATPMIGHLQLGNFLFEFEIPSYTLNIQNTEIQQFVVSNGFSSIFIPPKIA